MPTSVLCAPLPRALRQTVSEIGAHSSAEMGRGCKGPERSGKGSEQLRRAEGSQVESPHGLLGLDAGHVSTSPPQSYTDSVQQPQDSGCERGWLDHPVVRALQVGARIGTEGLLSTVK